METTIGDLNKPSTVGGIRWRRRRRHGGRLPRERCGRAGTRRQGLGQRVQGMGWVDP